MQGHPIEDLLRQFPGEWVLIEVVEMDEERTIPLRGRVIAHAADRSKIYKESSEREGNVLIEYSPTPKEEIAAVV